MSILQILVDTKCQYTQMSIFSRHKMSILQILVDTFTQNINFSRHIYTKCQYLVNGTRYNQINTYVCRKHIEQLM